MAKKKRRKKRGKKQAQEPSAIPRLLTAALIKRGMTPCALAIACGMHPSSIYPRLSGSAMNHRTLEELLGELHATITIDCITLTLAKHKGKVIGTIDKGDKR